MKKFKSHEITVKGTLGVTAINVKTVEDVEEAVQQIIPANYSEVSTRDGYYGIIETHETANGEYRYVLEYDGKNPYCATILDETNRIIGYVEITDEEIDEVAENYEKAQKKVELIGGRFYTKKDVVKSRKVNCTLGRSVSKDVHFTERVEISKEEAEEILKNYGFTAESYIAYKNGDKVEEKAVETAEEKNETVEVEEYAVSVEAQEVATQAEIDNARALQFNLKATNNVSDEEKIYRATSLIVKDYGSSPVTKDFKTAAAAFKYLKKKEKRYAATTEWEHTIQVWDSAEEADKYEECFSIAQEHTIYQIESYASEGEEFLAEEEFFAYLEPTLEDCKTVDTTTDAETNVIPEYKPALADKPYTCVTLRRYSEFSSSSFNPEKFFDTLRDAVKYALEDSIKRRGVDERYGGAVVYVDFENGMHRPLWQITSEGNFEMIDANNDYGELDNDAVKAELAELDADTLAALAAEVEIKTTLDKLAELKEAYPQIYSKVTADSAANVLTFKAKTSRKAKRIAS